MKIAAIVANLDGNPVVRAYPIVQVLRRHHKVVVHGLSMDGTVFEPYRKLLKYNVVRVRRTWSWPESAILKLVGQVNADVLYAFKPLGMTFGAALISRALRRQPLILDIEDWDNFHLHSQSRSQRLQLLRNCPRCPDTRMSFYDLLADLCHDRANCKTVASSFLKDRYGGFKLPHGPDTVRFNPKAFDRAAIRRRLGFDGLKIVLFAGTAVEHKGLPEAYDAVCKLKEERIKLVVCGVLTPVLKRLTSGNPEKLVYLGPQPHELMPELWLAADVVTIPQRNTPYARAQIPAKVFEAMAMERPIVATAVSDLPEILHNCGWIIPPENPELLAVAFRDALRDESLACEYGTRARQRCLRDYSWDAMDEILARVLRSVA